MIQVKDICERIEELAPLAAAASWDNVGLLLGFASAPVTGVVLSLDFDDKALALAKETSAGLIVCHHPAIFPTVNRLTNETAMGCRLLEAASAGIAVYAVHTNLDVCPGGVNDALAAVLGITVTDVIAVDPNAPELHQAALHTDEVRQLLHGKFDIPAIPFGYGRIGEISEHVTRRSMVRRVNNQLQTAGCILNFDEDKKVERIAVSGGSFDESWIPDLREKQVDLLISGEIKHHVLLALADAGIAAIMAGHEVSERVILHPLANYLGLRHPEILFAVHEGLDYNKIVF